MHAGAIATIADSACGYARLTQMPDGSAILSVEFEFNLLAPALAELFTARGRVTRVGRTLGVAMAVLAAHASSKHDSIVAIIQANMMKVEIKHCATA